MAKRRRRRSKRRSHSIVRRRRSHAPARTHRRRRSSGGGGRGMLGGIVPSGQELKELAATAVYGFLESKAKADPNFILNKVPKPVVQLGYAGGVALAARVLHKFFPNPYLKLFAAGAAHAAMYQMGREGGLPKDVNIFAIAGDYMEGGGYIGDEDMGALAEEGAFIHGEEGNIHGVSMFEPNQGT